MSLSFNSNTTGAISEAGTTDPFGATDHEFTPVLEGLYCSIFSFLWSTV